MILIAWLMHHILEALVEESFVLNIRETCQQFGVDERQHGHYSILQWIDALHKRSAHTRWKVIITVLNRFFSQLEVLFDTKLFSAEKMSQRCQC